MEITSENVEKIFTECLFQEGEDTSNHIKAQGVMLNVGFHPERLEKNRQNVKDILYQLPEPFQKSKGGGWSFLAACEDKNGNQWAEHRTIDQLMCLALALKQIELLLPRELWETLPGGMPYFAILD